MGQRQDHCRLNNNRRGAQKISNPYAQIYRKYILPSIFHFTKPKKKIEKPLKRSKKAIDLKYVVPFLECPSSLVYVSKYHRRHFESFPRVIDLAKSVARPRNQSSSIFHLVILL